MARTALPPNSGPVRTFGALRRLVLERGSGRVSAHGCAASSDAGARRWLGSFTKSMKSILWNVASWSLLASLSLAGTYVVIIRQL